MSTTEIEKRLPASFRDASFLVLSESVETGKKTVTHEYVGSNQRFTEELGELPPKFTLEGVVKTIQGRFTLEEELKKPGLGVLIHPIYGQLNVKSTTFTVSSNQTAIGEFRFTINFESSESAITADTTVVSNSEVSNKAEISREALDDTIEEVYAAPEEPIEILSAADKLGEIYDDVFTFTKSATLAVQSKVAAVSTVVTTVTRAINSIVQQPVLIKQSLRTLYGSVLDVVNTPQDLEDVWKSLIDFGFVDIKKATSTVSRTIEQTNKSVLNEHTRIEALINLTEALAYKDQVTETELDKDRKLINDTFARLIYNYNDDIDIETGTKALIQNSDLRLTLQGLRVIVNRVFDEKEKNAWKVTEISPGKTSLSQVAYRYYGGHEQLSTLQDLNSGANHANIDSNEIIQTVS